MTLNFPKFILATSYGLITMIAYILVAVALLRHWSQFRGSFFKIYLVSTVVFCAGLNFQFAYIQYLMTLMASVNRFTMIFFPTDYEKYWSHCLVPLVVVVLLGPFSATYPIIFGDAHYEYIPAFDEFAIKSSRTVAEYYAILVPFMVIVIVLDVVVCMASLAKLITYRSAYANRAAEVNLFLLTLINFTLQMLATCISIMLYVASAYASVESKWYTLGGLLLPFVSDGLTLVQPFLLLLFSSKLRSAISEMFIGRKNQNAVQNLKIIAL